MTHSAPVNIADELVDSFRKGDSVRFIKAQIKEEKMELSHTGNPSGSVESDYNSMQDHAGEEAAYFLFKQPSKEWILITYVPDSVAVKDKMLYASAKGALKDKLGHTNFGEELHLTTKDELTYSHYQGTKKPTDARSETEVQLEEIHKEEEVERQEQAKQIATKEKESGGSGTHSVTIPLSDTAKSSLAKLKTGEVNFVALVIDDAKTSINSIAAKKVDTTSMNPEVHTTEPRFYLYTPPGKSTVFVYCCPERSPPKLRMVYATAKANVITQVTASGISLAPNKLEVRDYSELVEELRDATVAKPSVVRASGNFGGRMIAPAPGSNIPSLGGTVKATNVPTINNQQHSVYGLMAAKGNMESATTKKKIVMPPRAAWGQ